jgi:FeS assembly SUF system regulator
LIRLTKLADYGVMLMSHIAAAPDSLHSASSLSRAASIAVPTVAKILKLLARKGLLASHRGAAGGYTLARPPAEISVAEVIAAMEGPIAVTECTDDTHSDCAVESVCRVRTNWQRINDAVRGALEQITLEEMAQPFPDASGRAGDFLVPLRGRAAGSGQAVPSTASDAMQPPVRSL